MMRRRPRYHQWRSSSWSIAVMRRSSMVLILAGAPALTAYGPLRGIHGAGRARPVGGLVPLRHRERLVLLRGSHGQTQGEGGTRQVCPFQDELPAHPLGQLTTDRQPEA